MGAVDKAVKSWDVTKWGGRSVGLLKGILPAPEPTPPPPPDITDLTIQSLMRSEAQKAGKGSRRSSFLTGGMNEKTDLPILGKSLITGG